mgnify:CR=1 FL=1
MKKGDLATFRCPLLRGTQPPIGLVIHYEAPQYSWSKGHAIIRWLTGSKTGHENVYRLNEVQRVHYGM